MRFLPTQPQFAPKFDKVTLWIFGHC